MELSLYYERQVPLPKKKRLLSICFVFALLCALCLSAHAAVDVPDESKTGTIRVTMLYNNQPVSGGTLSVYRVGDIHEDDGNYTFVLAEKFAGSNVTWTEETLGEPEVAKALSEYAAKNSIAADKTGTIGGDGKAALDGLALGLYLVKQEQPAAGYQCAEPFLVTVPYLEKETYLYDVDATPKVEPLKVPPDGSAVLRYTDHSGGGAAQHRAPDGYAAADRPAELAHPGAGGAGVDLLLLRVVPPLREKGPE